MTNGEKLCIDFPNMHYTLSEKQPRRVVTTIGVCASFDLEWWNAEYKEPSNSEKPNKSEIPTSSDCVDRHSVDLLAYRYLKEPTDNHMAFYEDFLDLPTVTPIRPKGHWIEHPHEWGDNWQYSQYECSCCHNWANFDTDYCPNCGIEMSEV